MLFQRIPELEKSFTREGFQIAEVGEYFCQIESFYFLGMTERRRK
jgi:hypothetical protein